MQIFICAAKRGDAIWPVPGSLDKKGGRRCHLLFNKRWTFIPSFLFNEPGTGHS
jgi:hypothetical protein